MSNGDKGGWGAWTMQRYKGEGIAHANTVNYPQHSFGTLGWSKKIDADDTS